MKNPRVSLSLLKWLTLLSLLTAKIYAWAAEQRSALPAGYRLLYVQTFEKPDAIRDFVMTDAKAWRIANTNGQSSLELVTQSQYKPLVRSPVNMALIAEKVFGILFWKRI